MINKIIDYLDVKLAQLMIYRIRKGYGCNCDTKDTDDFSGEDLSGSRCPSCKAREIVKWLEEYIELIKM